MRAKDDAIARARERVLEDFLGRARARGAPLPDGTTVALFAESIEVLLRQYPENDVTTRIEQAPRYVGVPERLRRTFDGALQGPLDAIALATSVLEAQVSLPQARRVQTIARAGAQLNRMLQDMRDFALCSVAIGGLRVARRSVDLRVICDRIVEDIRSAHPTQAIELLGARQLVGEWDPDRIADLLTKLLRNAIEHGRPVGFVIKVTVRALSDRAIIDVWNAGPPIGREPLGGIFEPFVRGETADRERAEGLGLGLYIAREIARAHGGTLEVQSTPIEGTTFRPTLPREP